MNLEWNGNKLRLRPSSIDGFFTCPRQWAGYYIGGEKSMPGARAAIGTAIHAGVEEMWKEAIAVKAKAPNLTMMKDAAVDEFILLDQNDDLNYDSGENLNSAQGEIRGGIEAFVEDIVPFTDIPMAVEERYTIALNHIMVEDISGTVDYIKEDTIADVKTSKRKPVPANYKTQQSIYKMLAQANGIDVKYNLIQGVVLKTQPQGHIMEMESDIPQAKFLVNSILDTLEVYHKDIIDPEILFRPNTKHYLCTPKYCSFYGKSCTATGGQGRPTQHVVKL
jgi:hypothetical protein